MLAQRESARRRKKQPGKPEWGREGPKTIGTLRSNDADDGENVKKKKLV